MNNEHANISLISFFTSNAVEVELLREHTGEEEADCCSCSEYERQRKLRSASQAAWQPAA